METHIAKWGNSLGIRLPKALLGELGLADGDSVTLEIKDSILTLKPLKARKRKKSKRYNLEEMLKTITPENQHPYMWDNEAWGAEEL